MNHAKWGRNCPIACASQNRAQLFCEPCRTKTNVRVGSKSPLPSADIASHRQSRDSHLIPRIGFVESRLCGERSLISSLGSS